MKEVRKDKYSRISLCIIELNNNTDELLSMKQTISQTQMTDLSSGKGVGRDGYEVWD